MAIDFSPIISAFVPTDIVGAILSISAVLASIYVACFAIMAVVGMFGIKFVFWIQ